jgi:hypothetical protein
MRAFYAAALAIASLSVASLSAADHRLVAMEPVGYVHSLQFWDLNNLGQALYSNEYKLWSEGGGTPHVVAFRHNWEPPLPDNAIVLVPWQAILDDLGGIHLTGSDTEGAWGVWFDSYRPAQTRLAAAE